MDSSMPMAADTGAPVGEADAMMSMPMEDSGMQVLEAGMDASCTSTIAACCNGTKNSNSPTFESDVDCGGPVCRKCTEGEICIANTDCESQKCNATTKTCDPVPPGSDAGGGTCCTDPNDNCAMMMNAGHVYFFCDANETWDAARAKCMGGGMDLVHVNDQAENDFLKDAINDNGDEAWIGAKAVSSAWVWIDDSQPLTYMNWNGSAPTPTDQCVWEESNGEWNEDGCDQDRGYVCEGVP